MSSKYFQTFLVVLLGALAIYFSHLQFVHLWIWILPFLGVSCFFHLPELRLSIKSREYLFLSFALLGLVGMGLSPLQGLNHPEWLVLFRAVLGVTGLLLLLLFYFCSRKPPVQSRKIFFLICISVALALFLVTKISSYPVMNVFLSPGWNKGGRPILLSGLDFSSFDIRYLLVLSHLLSTFLIYRMSLESESGFFRFAPCLIFLASPVMSFLMERSWNDSPYILALLVVFYALQNGRSFLYFVFLNVLLLILPEAVVLLPLLLWFSGKKFGQKWYWVLLKALGPAVLGWAVFILFNTRSLSGIFNFLSPENPLGDFSFSDWVFQYTQFSARITAWIVATAAYILIFFKNRRARMNFQELLFSLGFLSFACLNHLWFSLSFFFITLAVPEQESSSQKPNLSWAFFFFLGTRFFLLFSWPLRYTDTVYYVKIAQRIFDHHVPYIHFSFEYPPLALVPIFIPQLLTRLFGGSDGFLAYRTFHSLLYFCFDLFLFIFMQKLVKRGKMNGFGLWIYIIGGLIMGELLYDRLDLLLGLFLFFGGWWMAEAKFVKSFASLTLGIFLKLIPIIALPLLALKMLGSDKFKKRPVFFLSIFAAIFSALTFVSFALFRFHFLDFLLPHEKRGIQIESTWSSFYYLIQPLFPASLNPVRVTSMFGAFHIQQPVPWLLAIANVAPILMLLLFYAVCAFKLKTQGRLPWKKIFFLNVLIFILFCKVLSPQYMVWLICLLPLCDYSFKKSQEILIILLFIAALILTATLFHDYMRFVRMDTTLWKMLGLRNALLILMGIFIAVDAFSETTQKSEV